MKLKDKISLGLAGLVLGSALVLTKNQNQLSDSHRIVKDNQGGISLGIYEVSSIDRNGIHYDGMIPSKSYYDKEGDGIVDSVYINQPKQNTKPKIFIPSLAPENAAISFPIEWNPVYFNKREENPKLFKEADKEMEKVLHQIKNIKPDYIETNSFEAWNYQQYW